MLQPSKKKDRGSSLRAPTRDVELLELCERHGNAAPVPAQAFTRARISVSLALSLADIEKAVILATLREQSYNRWKAARSLGISIRTLERRIQRYKKER